MTRDDDDEEDEEDGFHYDGFRGDPQDPFDSAWRFGFSFGPDGMRIQEPPVFGQVLREMEDMISQMGRWKGEPESEYFGRTASYSLYRHYESSLLHFWPLFYGQSKCDA